MSKSLDLEIIKLWISRLNVDLYYLLIFIQNHLKFSKQPIRSQGILHLTNEDKGKVGMSKIERSKRFSVTFKSAQC